MTWSYIFLLIWFTLLIVAQAVLVKITLELYVYSNSQQKNKLFSSRNCVNIFYCYNKLIDDNEHPYNPIQRTISLIPPVTNHFDLSDFQRTRLPHRTNFLYAVIVEVRSELFDYV